MWGDQIGHIRSLSSPISHPNLGPRVVRMKFHPNPFFRFFIPFYVFCLFIIFFVFCFIKKGNRSEFDLFFFLFDYLFYLLFIFLILSLLFLFIFYYIQTKMGVYSIYGKLKVFACKLYCINLKLLKWKAKDLYL